uniref:Uncharacterized protein n=1 Tax=Rhipicephalus appendiculatus TaxID=34631 RepID=A0A131YBW1_RHIAP
MMLHEQRHVVFHQHATSSVTSTKYFHACATCFVHAVSMHTANGTQLNGALNHFPKQSPNDVSIGVRCLTNGLLQNFLESVKNEWSHGDLWHALNVSSHPYECIGS